MVTVAIHPSVRLGDGGSMKSRRVPTEMAMYVRRTGPNATLAQRRN